MNKETVKTIETSETREIKKNIDEQFNTIKYIKIHASKLKPVNVYQYHKKMKLIIDLNKKVKFKETKFKFICGNTLELIETSSNKLTCLICGNSNYSGGQWKEGCSSQEEMICRKTNILPHYVNVKYPLKANSTVLFEDLSLIKNEFGDILTKHPIFNGILGCAVNNPTLKKAYGGYVLAPNEEKKMIDRISSILITCYNHKCYDLVLGAFGCDTCKNPPYSVAMIFKNLLKNKFKNKFRSINFIIKDEHILNIFEKIINLEPEQDIDIK